MITVYTDGATVGNPGPSSAGIYIKYDKNILEYSIKLGDMSNHEAEFWAIIKALEICNEQFPNEILSFRSDSRAAVDAIERRHTKNPQFQSLLEEIIKKADRHPYFFIKWIPDKQNGHADRLARGGITKRES